ncbi:MULTISPECIES: twin-arginine translocase subunit TatC [unclassified Modestobacter]|uniref:twin-arginine translocase subunit TatC n=1 Tax=unclassified Modestobacter TaxID=2643866 RepID=UPI0022AA2103|nr:MULTISPECIES: twin-arginine translocase subunit TatC [unclassified Modestobacter]MCZ2811848.1 twin-arginine translocase subunit TatC [Modestobacter sp. VKM Ac-2979]MCZ2843571.1 twin-arginine translocase subunit TatC [Modestobacter sp. VKM Ac-2980]MCZ2850926.1 twin-arginine translocase subunit TatC [Modestobacter sp. VKM Ac-2978]
MRDRRPRRPERDAAATMSLIGHLRELRNRIGIALFFVLIGTAVAFWWYEQGLGEFIRAPYCGLAAGDRGLPNQPDGDCDLLVIDVLGGALIRLKISFIVGVVLAAPFWLYQVWAFLTPGLKKSEKRYGVAFVAASSSLFALGAALAYIALSKGLELLIGLAGDGVTVALTAQEYVGFVISLLVAFGVSFELPLIAVVLNLIGVLSYEALSKSRRWIYFLTIVFAAFITPTQDPFTMLLMAAPMCVLFEIAIQIARFVDKRRAKREAAAGLAGLDDDEASPSIDVASPLDTTPSPLDEPEHLRR